MCWRAEKAAAEQQVERHRAAAAEAERRRLSATADANRLRELLQHTEKDAEQASEAGAGPLLLPCRSRVLP